MDSPFGFCLTPVGSLCASPVPLSFMEHYDPVVAMAGIFPVHVGTPLGPPSTSNLMESPFQTPPFPESMTFPHTDSFIPPPYFPVQQHVLFSPSSAFAPLGISKASTAPTSMQASTCVTPETPRPASLGFSTSLSPTPMSVSTSKPASLTDRTIQMSRLSPESPVTSAHKSVSPASAPYSHLVESCDNAAPDTARGTDPRGAADTTGYDYSVAECVSSNTPTSPCQADDDKYVPGWLLAYLLILLWCCEFATDEFVIIWAHGLALSIILVPWWQVECDCSIDHVTVCGDHLHCAPVWLKPIPASSVHFSLSFIHADVYTVQSTGDGLHSVSAFYTYICTSYTSY